MKLRNVLWLICGTCSLLFSPFSIAASENTDKSQQTQVVIVSDKLNLNTATAEQLQKGLVGIGAKKAQAIVEYRQQHGSFTAIEQLTEVKGIGTAILEKNKERITVE